MASMTAKAELGIKRVCPSCGVRFYDLQKRPIECPKCAFSFEPEALYKQRRPRQPEPVQAEPAPADAEEEEAEETEEEEVETVEPVAEEPPLETADTDDEETAEETETPDAGMSVVEGEEDIEDIAVEDDEEEEADDTLLEEVEEDEEDVAGIIDPDIVKDER